MMQTYSFCFQLLPVVASILFILTLRGLSTPSTSDRGNLYGMLGMAIAIFYPFLQVMDFSSPSDTTTLPILIPVVAMLLGGAIGFYIAKKIYMTALPQLVAAFHSLVGLAAIFVACAVLTAPQAFGIIDDGTSSIRIANAIEMSVGAAIGAVTFTGSVVAFGKLHGLISGKRQQYSGQHKVNLITATITIAAITAFVINQAPWLFVVVILMSLLIGILLIMPIGGADMPVVVSMLNSYSGWAATGIGFTLGNDLLIIVGALVGTSGAILSSIMCKGMNRSLVNVIFGGIGGGGAQASETTQSSSDGKNVKLCSPEDAAFIMQNAGSVIVVPGYGMAVAQAQHAIKELADMLKLDGITVKYAIHPVAGRMPGHMNVLLAESNIPYDDVFELDHINHEFSSTDVAIVVGANDITNPAAKTDPTSPIFGMPVLDVEKAKTVLFVKRSLGSGYAGIDNSLFYQANTMMILGDAKKVIEGILRAMKEQAH
ncbi:MAG: NAD(P)(+) transhydrogenase (Re/Si-specific) subunit beta [Holosporales bacterium]|jgi:NAD(P) transhydrogenase subunit beta|nr:NAD(P)(+) transhydrogenase (Re/Si-specific) subunit beta [Holosporales bacterium]